ncbi:uncharacterized protein LOC113296095 [Papaver somniferum]|uniref:uncharacterized protein LOC113296095 n=1 Tax=Papaver somniferum TaxID=3469 RepID=UPI000E6F7D64|nr:uncharacterized protein LOC113296095 [Papaver somniferum]
MRLVLWNIRGILRQKDKDKLRALVTHHNPSLVFIAEPKIHYNSKNRIKLPGMSHKIIHNTVDGRKAKLWLFWNNSITAPIVIHSSRQSITVEVGGVLVTGVHVDVLCINKRALWAELAPFSTSNKPWIILGDFNTISTLDEKKGGRVPLNSSIAEFNEWIDNCELLHAAKTGLQFSWSNGRCGRKRILCNLDRCLFNSQWLEKYPWWKYHVTARGISDHSILIGSNSEIHKPLNCPFKFQQMWITHPGLLQVTLSEAEKKVTETNKLSDADPQNIKLLNDYVTARGVRDIAAQNYHTMLRQTRNAIAGLEDASGTLITNQNEIASNLISYFSDKFKEQPVEISDTILNVTPQVINDDDNALLDCIPSGEEIKNAVFELNQDGSPGPDGFTGIFYRFAWDIIQEDLVEALRYCWKFQVIPPGVNSNFLVLLPKIKGAKRADQFRPIGLSNFFFKILTKIITVRMSTLLHKLVSPQQCAFVKGRNIHEQVLLASELVNKMKTKKRRGDS